MGTRPRPAHSRLSLPALSRSGCPVAQSESARELMEGRSATEILEALDDQSWQAAIASNPELAPHEELLEALARSAVKTIQVTAAIWNDEIG